MVTVSQCLVLENAFAAMKFTLYIKKYKKVKRIFHASLYMMALFLCASTYGCCKLHISNTVSSMEILLQAKQIVKLVVIKKYVVTNTVSFLQVIQVCCL